MELFIGLLGAAIGVAGGVVVAVVQMKHDSAERRRAESRTVAEQRRLACVDLLSATRRLRQITLRTFQRRAHEDAVDEVRSSCDAILVGVATVRNDNPRLLVRSALRRADRIARGLPASPTKVTVTRGGDLDPNADFFACGDAEKIVYCCRPTLDLTRSRLGSVAEVVEGGPDVDVDLRAICEDLSARGVNRLMVEGGGSMHTQFLIAELTKAT